MSTHDAQEDAIECEQKNTETLSEYERGRLESIRRNKEILAHLGIEDSSLLGTKEEGKSKTRRKRNKGDKDPARKSTRQREKLEEGAYAEVSENELRKRGRMEMQEMPSLPTLKSNKGGKGFMTSPKGQHLNLSIGGGSSQSSRIKDICDAGPVSKSSKSHEGDRRLKKTAKSHSTERPLKMRKEKEPEQTDHEGGKHEMVETEIMFMENDLYSAIEQEDNSAPNEIDMDNLINMKSVVGDFDINDLLQDGVWGSGGEILGGGGAGSEGGGGAGASLGGGARPGEGRGGKGWRSRGAPAA